MDAPQWYNSRLWNTSKQSIDGKPIKPPMRPQSASTAFHRPGFNIQPMTGNWSNFMRVPNTPHSYRDQSFTFRYTNPYRVSKSPVNKLTNSFTSKYYNSQSPSFNFPAKTVDRINSAQITANKPKNPNCTGDVISLQGEPKLLSYYNPNKYFIKPPPVENEHQAFAPPSKQEVVHGNINMDDQSSDIDETNSDTDLSPNLSKNVINPVPQNTPRIFDLSSPIRLPTKSILKKATADNDQPKIPIFTIYNNFYPSRVRTISASSKSLMSSQQVNSFSDLRKSLQSAPGSKREVRFDMANNNVIEYSPND